MTKAKIKNTNTRTILKFLISGFICTFFAFIIFYIGVSFHRTGERYFGYLVDAAYKRDSNNFSGNNDSEGKVVTNLNIPVRRIKLSRDPNKYDDESDRIIIEENLSVDSGRTGLLLIDVWDVTNEPNDGYREKTFTRTRDRIVPLLEKARKAGCQIFHSPNGTAISKDIQVLEGEIDLSWTTQLPIKMQTMYFYNLARSKGIDTLLIAGFSTPMCVYERPIGVAALSRYEGIKMILVRDATHTWEYSDFGNNTFTRTYIEYLEHRFLRTTTVEGIKTNGD